MTGLATSPAHIGAPEARFQLLCSTLSDGVMISEGGIIREVNGSLVSMFGYSEAELIGSSAASLVAEESRAEVLQRMKNSIEGHYVVTGLKKDGSRALVEVSGKTLIEGARVLRVTTLRDITERHRLEEQFRQAQKMEAIGRLAGGVAHDFNNLLTVITSYAEMVTNDMAPSDPRRMDMGEISRAADAAATLTRQLLAFSRRQVAEPRRMVLEEVLSSSQKLLRRLIGEDVELVTNLSATESRVVMDPGQLEQIFMNLAVNARDAMPRGGKLTIETASVELSDDYAATHWPVKAGRYAMLAVSDTGHGMDKETMARIFEPFFTTKEAGKGTGLGLATVYGIVKQNNGFIWVYSEPSQGATFKVYLPLLADSGGSESCQPESPVSSGIQGKETILLVEDSAAVRRAARQILVRLGYAVLECSSADGAMELAERSSQSIDLLLTDVIMPVMGGRELARRLQARRPELRVLYMSGYPDQAVLENGMLEPDLAYLQKPFSTRSLGSKVRQLLDRGECARCGPGAQRMD